MEGENVPEGKKRIGRDQYRKGKNKETEGVFFSNFFFSNRAKCTGRGVRDKDERIRNWEHCTETWSRLCQQALEPAKYIVQDRARQGREKERD